jgi:hypothetical protein
VSLPPRYAGPRFSATRGTPTYLASCRRAPAAATDLPGGRSMDLAVTRSESMDHGPDDKKCMRPAICLGRVLLTLVRPARCQQVHEATDREVYLRNSSAIDDGSNLKKRNSSAVVVDAWIKSGAFPNRELCLRWMSNQPHSRRHHPRAYVYIATCGIREELYSSTRGQQFCQDGVMQVSVKFGKTAGIGPAPQSSWDHLV